MIHYMHHKWFAHNLHTPTNHLQQHYMKFVNNSLKNCPVLDYQIRTRICQVLHLELIRIDASSAAVLNTTQTNIQKTMTNRESNQEEGLGLNMQFFEDETWHENIAYQESTHLYITDCCIISCS